MGMGNVGFISSLINFDKRIIKKLNIIQGYPRCKASVKQGGEPKVNIKDPYRTSFMKKTDDSNSIVLETKKLSEKMKNMKEVKTGRKVNITSGPSKEKS